MISSLTLCYIPKSMTVLSKSVLLCWVIVKKNLLFQMTEKWEDVRVSVIRPGLTDPDGPCANAIPQDDDKAASLQPGKRQ